MTDTISGDKIDAVLAILGLTDIALGVTHVRMAATEVTTATIDVCLREHDREVLDALELSDDFPNVKSIDITRGTLTAVVYDHEAGKHEVREYKIEYPEAINDVA